MTISSAYNIAESYLHVEDMAQRFGMSARWVYDHAYELGGFKVGGTLFFTEKGLSDAIQRRQAMACHSKIQKPKITNATVSDKGRRSKVGNAEKERGENVRKNLAKRAGFVEFL